MLGWRGNPDNLLFTEESPLRHKHFGWSPNELTHVSNDKRESIKLGDRKFPSVDSLDGMQWQPSLLMGPVKDVQTSENERAFLVTIDSGVPRRPPAGKRANDRICYPKVIELILNDTDYAARILHDISGGNIGLEGIAPFTISQMEVVKTFQKGLRRGIRDMQNLYVFLLKLSKMLQIVLQKFFQSIAMIFPSESENKNNSPVPEGIPQNDGSPMSHTRLLPTEKGSCEEVKMQDHSYENVIGNGLLNISVIKVAHMKVLS